VRRGAGIVNKVILIGNEITKSGKTSIPALGIQLVGRSAAGVTVTPAKAGGQKIENTGYRLSPA
jgi:hypothetical protein